MALANKSVDPHKYLIPDICVCTVYIVCIHVPVCLCMHACFKFVCIVPSAAKIDAKAQRLHTGHTDVLPADFPDI